VKAAAGDRFAQELALVVGEEEATAQEAFGRLTDLVRPAALRRLMRQGANAQDAQDAVQTALADLWKARRSLTARTGGAWYALVRLAVARAHARRWKKETTDATLVQEWGIPPQDMPSLDVAFAVAEDRRSLSRAADALWLGNATEEAELGAAAIQLVLRHRIEIEEAAATFGVSTERVQRWLRDPAVVARALYSALCWPGDDLAGHVLRPEAPLTPRELDRLMGGGAEAISLAGWTNLEARVVCWRLRNGMSEDEIVQVSGRSLARHEVEAILAKAREAIPYARIALTMRQGLEASGDPTPLAKAGLWKRMAFEYALRELSQPIVVELAKPPAEVAPFPLTPDQINNWLSGGRLARQLAEFLLKEMS